MAATYFFGGREKNGMRFFRVYKGAGEDLDMCTKVSGVLRTFSLSPLLCVCSCFFRVWCFVAAPLGGMEVGW